MAESIVAKSTPQATKQTNRKKRSRSKKAPMRTDTEVRRQLTALEIAASEFRDGLADARSTVAFICRAMHLSELMFKYSQYPDWKLIELGHKKLDEISAAIQKERPHYVKRWNAKASAPIDLQGLIRQDIDHEFALNRKGGAR